MTLLDAFALIVLVVLTVATVTIWAVLGMLPGKIARARGHPQAEAINVCGWWGVITMGLLLPLAFIWAYTVPHPGAATQSSTTGISQRSAAEEQES
jgi:multisubunit Na+/H+ antiporter MnhB subunit